ncbi:MmcQ/YjbR family DNA-binding protein [Belliella kenyensis]|uniref:MmcQ/YjbR family DNA-binding protein n=1 Tax=Belliella kenyensis TaxID=1472724 RepID=A0ABV8EJL7_9BACT|nr:MmcQ/YjbR family DNA-binding protein [Belliella kenyensis]MCH7403110.1 MmcQ/YjbR family DNA-binding protein [Belliella kenyensis]MDN3602279.1 MmcQ/YjbR family DNA-binding protein [Belliella kenyensis]
MEIIAFRSYCLDKLGVTEDTPFDEDTLCFKVGGKIFAIVDITKFESVNLKCDPEKAVELREMYHAVSPGYHMNKKHWNTIAFNSDLPDSKLLQWVDHSYNLVYNSLSKKVKQEIAIK